MIAALGSRGDICISTVGSADYIVDVIGFLAGPAPTGPAAMCPSIPATNTPTSDLVRFSELHRGIGIDRIAVWVCDVPSTTTNEFYTETWPVTVDENVVSAWANDEVSPYFTAISQGQYTATFSPLGRIPLTDSDGPDACLDRAGAATGGSFTNVLATDTRDSAEFLGFGGPGLIYSYGLDTDVFESGAPNQSRRGMWVGGRSTSELPSPLVVAHEIGHTLHWPHSYIDAGYPYDNNLDLMSGAPIEGYCQSGGRSWLCSPPNTLAFNRFASGWFGGDRVVVHDRGTVNVTLDAPMGAGNQMVLVREAGQPSSMMSIEARPATGFDASSQKPGVAVHLIDQRPVGNGQIVDGYSTRRRQRQAVGVSGSYAHVVGLGETLAAHGVTITVLAKRRAGYVVQVAGTYQRPADSFFEAIGRPIVDPCSGDDLMAALEAGCVR